MDDQLKQDILQALKTGMAYAEEFKETHPFTKVPVRDDVDFIENVMERVKNV